MDNGHFSPPGPEPPPFFAPASSPHASGAPGAWSTASSAFRHPGIIRRTIAFGVDLCLLIPVWVFAARPLLGYLDAWLLQMPVYDVEGKVLAQTLADLEVLRVLMLIAFLVLYFAVLESWVMTASIGKLFVGIAVTDTGGRPCSFLRAMIRTLAACLTVATLGIGMLPALIGARARGLHDLLSGTMPIRSV